MIAADRPINFTINYPITRLPDYQMCPC